MKFQYDSESGTAYIGYPKKKVKFSLDLMDAFVIDIGFDKKVVGIEIIDAKEVLKDFGVNYKKIENVKMNVKHTENYFIVILAFKQKNVSKDIAIPLSPALAR